MAGSENPDEVKVPWRRWARLAWRTFLIGYLVVVVSFTLLQRYLIYVPTRVTPAAAESEAAKDGLVAWRNQTGQLIGWKLSAGSAPAGSVLIANGNAGWALNRAFLAQTIHDAAPLDVYLLEYPGFGARDGSPTERSVLAAADEAFGKLPEQLPVYLVSESLGTGVAAHLAQNNPARVAGLAMFVPYDKLASVAANHVPFIPAYFLLWDRFDPAAWLKAYHGPVKFIVAGADEIIPPKLGLRLHDGYAGPKQLQVIPNAHHNDAAFQSADWWRATIAFWQQTNVTNRLSTTAR